ncbi:MAG: alpha/beta hydrolase, partial [Cryomorphaceae bacterium]
MNQRIQIIPGISLVLLLLLLSATRPVEATKIYLIPGQGSDARIFSKIEFPEGYEVVYVAYELPNEGESMADYARKLARQIEEDTGFILIGVSLGGMLASEIAEFKHPKQVILIASAQNANELPKRYTFQRRLPLYKLVGPKLSKWGA